MTTGNPRPEPPPSVPPLSTGQSWAAWLRRAHPRLAVQQPPAGRTAAAAWDVLIWFARRNGFAADLDDCGVKEGVTTWGDRRIRVRRDATAVQAVTALAHQIGHVLLHSEIARLEPTGTVPCHGTRKVEADSVAYLVAAHLGIDPPAIDFPRVSSWAGTDPRSNSSTTIQTVSDRILTTAAAITAYLDAQLGFDQESAAPIPAATPEVHQAAAEPPPAPRSDLVHVHETALQFFRAQLSDSWVPGYLNTRGFGPAIQHQWQTGYAPAQWTALTTHLRAEGYPDELIEASGLARQSRRETLIDTFRDRAMLPIHNIDGTLVAFIGRASPQSAANIPKYLNSPHTDLYDKSTELFGLWQARTALADGAHPVITEGPFDAIAVTTANPARWAGLAPCGTALTASQLARLDHLVGLRGAGVLVAFDPDEAGQRAAVKAYHLLSPLTDRAEAVTFPPGQDPAQTLKDCGRITLAETLAGRVHPLADVAIEAQIARWSRWLDHVEGKMNALRAAAPVIAALPPAQVGRQVVRLAYRLRLDHPTVTEAVTDALTDIIEAGNYRTSRGSSLTSPGLDRSSAACGVARTGTQQRVQASRRNPRQNAQDRTSTVPPRASQDFPHTVQQALTRPTATTRPPGRSTTSTNRRPLMTRRIPR
jgi:DNA primase